MTREKWGNKEGFQSSVMDLPTRTAKRAKAPAGGRTLSWTKDGGFGRSWSCQLSGFESQDCEQTCFCWLISEPLALCYVIPGSRILPLVLATSVPFLRGFPLNSWICLDHLPACSHFQCSKIDCITCIYLLNCSFFKKVSAPQCQGCLFYSLL